MSGTLESSILASDLLSIYLPGNSYCSRIKQILYVATPKVACTSVKWWFAELEGISKDIFDAAGSDESDPDLVIHDTFYKVAPHVTGLPLNELVEVLSLDTFFRFAVVRNPYKRVFSAWQSKLLLREPFQSQKYWDKNFFNLPVDSISNIRDAFESFLEHLATFESPRYWDIHWTPQYQLLRPDIINYSVIGKIEEVGILESLLSQHLGSDFSSPFARKRTNESLIPFHSDFISDKAVKLIRDLYGEDFRSFDYSLNLPANSSPVISNDQMQTAISAIRMIRGRHLRLSEIKHKYLKEISQVISQREALAETLKIRDQENNRLRQSVAEQEQENNRLRQSVAEQEQENNRLCQSVAEQEQENNRLCQSVAEQEQENNRLMQILDRIYNSTYWQLLAPARKIKAWSSRFKKLYENSYTDR
jgi:hypothetical protein